MIIIGLTGSIGMGKSTAATMLRARGYPVYDADRVVHRLLGRGGAAVDAVTRRWPETAVDGAVDRRTLGQWVFENPDELRALEDILHPLVRRAEKRFLMSACWNRRPLVVLDIPLLFETGGDRRVDRVIVVSAPAFLQRQRLMRRPGMTIDRLRRVLDQQMPDREKRRRADWVVTSGRGRAVTYRALGGAMRRCRRRIAKRCWRPGRARGNANGRAGRGRHA